MKDLIIQALDSFSATFEQTVPKTKPKTILVDIEGVSPVNLVSFMKENQIPNDAWFAGRPNGYDGFDQVCLAYEIQVPTTHEDNMKFKRRVFGTRVFKKVYDILTANGYKRKGFNSALLADYDNTTVYDMYVCMSFDRLVSYYSLYFSKLSEGKQHANC